MTFTIVAASPELGLLGVATASKSFAVGAGVPAIRPGVGAVASQAYTNRGLRQHTLDELERGKSPEAIVASLAEIDPGADFRQLAVVAANGAVATHTGSRCSPFAGSIHGDAFTVLGNLLTGHEVLEAMARTFTSKERPTSTEVFAERLLATLAAGERAGGDVRGRQSASILVADTAEPTAPSLDIRVDDHEEPLTELARLLTIALDVRASA